MQYEMYNYGTTPATYFPPSSDKIAVEYIGSSTLDDRDRRRRRSGSTSTSSTKDKDSPTNMHLVSNVAGKPHGSRTDHDFSDGAHRIVPPSELSENARKSMLRASSINWRISTRSIKTSSSRIADKRVKSPDSTHASLNLRPSWDLCGHVKISPSPRC